MGELLWLLWAFGVLVVAALYVLWRAVATLRDLLETLAAVVFDDGAEDDDATAPTSEPPSAN